MNTSADRACDAPRMSIVVPSYQRRDSLLRLLRSIDDAIDGSGGTEVVVVLDGSTDGSSEALDGLDLDVEVRWRWQPNAGRSVARNAGVSMARGRVCWLVDDDMTVTRTAWCAHLDFHAASAEPSVLVGPQWETDSDGPPFDFLAERVDRLARAGSITDPFDFWTGNVSLPRQTLVDVGGFCERFVGWGEEDVELGFRLVDTGVPITFDVAAGGRHWRRRPLSHQIRDERERGRNVVRLVDIHPQATRRIIPASAVVVDLHRRNVRSPKVYGAMARAAGLMLRSQRIAASGQRDRLYNIGMSAALLAGVIEAGGSERLQTRVTVNHWTFRHGDTPDAADEQPAAADDQPPTKRPAESTEYATMGMLRRSGVLADPSVLADLEADAPRFARAVADMARRGRYRVPYAFTPAIERVARDEAITGAIEHIFGDHRWVAWGANIQIGTPNDASAWHTDIESLFWPTITVVVGIRGCRAANTTRYIPGSQRLPVGPQACGDATDEELVLATAKMLDPRCRKVVVFDGFGDGRFSVFDAKGWHRGDIEASADRLALFLHYQRADAPRIPYMDDFTKGTWQTQAAPFMPNPALGGDFERTVDAAPFVPSTGGRLERSVRRVVNTLNRGRDD